MRIYYLFILSPLFVLAQAPHQLSDVIRNTDVESLKQLSVEFNLEYEQRNLRIEQYLQLNTNVPRRFIEDEVEYEIFDISNDEPVYSHTTNRGAAITARANRLYDGGPMGLDVQGQGMTAYVWDGGIVRNTHNEFPNGKVINVDFASTPSFHATHVTGTIVAQGFQTNLRGVAFDASARSYDWNNDYSQMSTAASQGMLVSNHSYWSGSSSGVWIFGAYDQRARQLDQILFAAPFYLFVGSAGNDRNDFSDPVIGPYLAQKSGFNLIKGMHNSKNSLTVGAVDQVNTYTSSQSVVMSSFSSWGPTDDGRIKPDIVTKGTNVRSTSSASDTADAISQGTSMAAPGVTGVALLLQQHHFNLMNQFMRGATLKGLILHTADEAGFWPGPDYRFGWGLINAERAAGVITNTANQINVMQENMLTEGQTYTFEVYATGNEPLVASISWSDRAALANNGTNDPTNILLTNDLDLRIIGNGETHFPWTLDPENLSFPAARNTDNFRDNFEKVEIDNPVAGTYIVQVTHKGNLVSGNQTYSLIVSGINQTLSTNSLVADEFRIYPNPARGSFNIASPSYSGDLQLELFDVQGRRVMERKISGSQNEISLQAIPTGVYMVRLSSDSGAITKKLVIQ